jgi:hypothetical protein
MAKSFARLDAFSRGRIVGQQEAGASMAKIAKTVRRKDGSASTLRAVQGVVMKFAEDSAWRGEESSAGGRPLLLTEAEHAKLRASVFKDRGRVVVTDPYCQRRLHFLHEVSKGTVRDALHRIGLAPPTRRVKSVVPKFYKASRMWEDF